ncbi:hypothetical protein NC661_19705 [Aquibacillus koreensis]|uniref:Uncharacterized protein n=1 Tax=Aquibacillus koreensis TaxID=279446 RepID=A0A9X3WPY4_9BACI|nr:hypothetical protein [Aquibacillus koreensis]MCT2534191.1 hypothetical protein [Aquibacillus koreensis]MDC3422583.1 hypothetical protein [Aquibacillus koreensis]
MRSEKNKVINLNDYKRIKNGLDKPIFDEPVTISIGDPEQPDSYGEYTVLCNLVHDDRQFLALEREDQVEELNLLVEAIVEDGELAKVKPITDEEYEDIESIFQDIFTKISEEQPNEHKGSRFRRN